MNYEWLDLAVMYCLYTLSPLGLIIGGYLMYEGTAKSISQKSVNWLAYSMYGCLCTLASLLSLLVIIQI